MSCLDLFNQIIDLPIAIEVPYGHCMRRLGFVVGLSLLAGVPVLLAPASGDASETSGTAAATESTIQAVYVKVGLTWDKSTHRHPGFLMAVDEEGVFEIQCEGRTHAITVSFIDVGAQHLTLSIKYAINGAVQWNDSLEVEAGTDTVLQKGKAKLTFNADPQGSEDSSRDDEDKIEGPTDDPDDPLGGIKLK
jgi:hypothetical protein